MEIRTEHPCSFPMAQYLYIFISTTCESSRQTLPLCVIWSPIN